MAEFATSVSLLEEGRCLIRGYSHERLIGRVTYASAAYLTIVGELPAPPLDRLVDAMLTSLLDDGFVAATVSAARYIASGNPQLVPAVAGGLLAAGQNTLSPEHSFVLLDRAFELAADGALSTDDAADAVVREYRSRRQRIPGLGHPVHRSSDFRADRLFELAAELGLEGESTRMVRAIHAAFTRETGRRLPINIDGCLACLGRDIGLTAPQIVSFAILAVLPGVMAHTIEEIESDHPLRFIRDGEYVGERERPLPAVLDGGAA
jgi:citrate synthase